MPDHDDPALLDELAARSKAGPPLPFTPATAIDFAWIPGGRFHTGCASKDCFHGTTPREAVDVPAFWLSRVPATVRQYRACEDAGGCPAVDVHGANGIPGLCTAGHPVLLGLFTAGRDDALDAPLNCVGAIAAATFCRWLGGRLPTRLEHEYATRGGPLDRTYVFGFARDRAPGHDFGYPTSPGWTADPPTAPFGLVNLDGPFDEIVTEGEPTATRTLFSAAGTAGSRSAIDAGDYYGYSLEKQGDSRYGFRCAAGPAPASQPP